MCAQFDADSNGTIDFQEFLAWKTLNEEPGPANEDDVRELFKEIDEDGSGTLDPEEVRQMLTKLGVEKVNDESLQEVFTKMDPDGDGEVTLDEFLGWWSAEGEEFKAKIESLIVSSVCGRAISARAARVLHQLSYCATVLRHFILTCMCPGTGETEGSKQEEERQEESSRQEEEMSRPVACDSSRARLPRSLLAVPVWYDMIVPSCL